MGWEGKGAIEVESEMDVRDRQGWGRYRGNKEIIVPFFYIAFLIFFILRV